MFRGRVGNLELGHDPVRAPAGVQERSGQGALLLIGDAEQLYEPHAALTLAQARMPALEGAIVPDADHIAAMAQPEDVNARIVQFLQQRGDR